MSNTPNKCRISDITEILESINLALVKSKKREIKKRDWHTALSSLTENNIKPFWINEFFRNNFVDPINAEKVKVAIEMHIKDVGLKMPVKLECTGG